MIKAPRRLAARLAPRLTVDALDDDGAGVGTFEGARLHVPFALPGEIVDAAVEHESHHRPEAWGRLLEVVQPSPARVSPACAAWGRCGGCVLQQLDHREQLAWKRRFVEAALASAGIAARVEPCAGPSGASASSAGGSSDGEVARATPLGFRNREKLVFAREGARVVLGAYAPRSHRVVDLAGCRVVAPPLDEVARRLARLSTELRVRVYDERTGAGDARYAILREDGRGSTQVMLVVARRDVAEVAELARALRRELPAVVGVVENWQPSRGNALVGAVEPDRVLDGDPTLVAEAGVRLRLSPRSFFQAGYAMARVLYEAVAEAAALAPGEVALDVYCGVGGIALTLAARAPLAHVLGVEESEDAVVDACAGAALNGLGRVRFERADATRFLEERAASGARTDVVTVDPPRKGLEPRALAALRALAPRAIVYVSCAPATLARDLRLLLDGGRYRLRSVRPHDLMPHTPHVEVVAHLVRADAP